MNGQVSGQAHCAALVVETGRLLGSVVSFRSSLRSVAVAWTGRCRGESDRLIARGACMRFSPRRGSVPPLAAALYFVVVEMSVCLDPLTTLAHSDQACNIRRVISGRG